MAIVIRRETDGWFYATRVVWAILWVVDVILGLRFLLRLLAANSAAAFTDFVYRSSRPLLDPFVNVARSTRLDNGGVVEWSVIIAMLVYGLVAWAVIRLLYMTDPDYTEEV